MNQSSAKSITLGNHDFEIIKDSRLRDGMVVKSGNIYGRVGPRSITQQEQAHTAALHDRGFPVPSIINSGPYGQADWFFTESSLGTLPFHVLFATEYQKYGVVSSKTFATYLSIIEKYAEAQMALSNRAVSNSDVFIVNMIPDHRVLPSYRYFGHNVENYKTAINQAAAKLADAAAGILQYDLNPYNIMERGVIDFELVGHGPIGYDVLTSARWAGSWFTDYPSRYPISYKLNDAQIAANDALIDQIAERNNIGTPSQYINEFLLLKSAWAVSDFVAPKSDWPTDKLDFRNFRANVLHTVVNDYLAGKSIDYKSLSSIICIIGGSNTSTG